MQLYNIPHELRALPQWVVSGADKAPINPCSGNSADVTNPATWGTFDDALRAGYPNIGFVLADSDPFTIIDLDEPLNADQMARHQRIFEAFQTYAEISQSGKGIHIIMRGRVEQGRRKDRVEVYSRDRYMICTGNTINRLPVEDHQALLDILIAEMPVSNAVELVEVNALLSDSDLWTMGTNAVNGEKFRALWSGSFCGHPSQSEADYALISMLAFYSKSNEQVRRVFRMSELGKRDKATRNNDYLDRMLSKMRAKDVTPMVDLTGLLAGLTSSPAPEPPPVPPLTPPAIPEQTAATTVNPYEPPPAPPAAPSIAYPPGLVGEIASYIYSSAIRPVHEVGLTAALALTAGICGRHYNISGTGLNQYIVLLAGTGTGKEGAASGMDALVSHVATQIPAAWEFMGPAHFASGQALTRVLDKKPSFVSVLGEIGLSLQQWCDARASAPNVQLRKVLLDVYAKSGWGKLLRSSVYSDSDKNTAEVRSPNVTILGESTQENFYGALDTAHIAEGLLPRFLVIEYKGERPPPNRLAFHAPPAQLVNRLASLVQKVFVMRSNDAHVPVKLSHEARDLMDAWSDTADAEINANAGEVSKQLWNRAHLKALKLAGLVAVGIDSENPIVSGYVAQWAIDVVRRDVSNMISQFTSGAVGQGDHTQEADVISACNRYETMTAKQRTQYGVPQGLLDRDNVLPYAFLSRYLKQRAAFKNDKRGAITALKIVLDDMAKAGRLSLVPAPQALEHFKTTSPLYYRGESWK